MDLDIRAARSPPRAVLCGEGQQLTVRGQGGCLVGQQSVLGHHEAGTPLPGPLAGQPARAEVVPDRQDLLQLGQDGGNRTVCTHDLRPPDLMGDTHPRQGRRVRCGHQIGDASHLRTGRDGLDEGRHLGGAIGFEGDQGVDGLRTTDEPPRRRPVRPEPSLESTGPRLLAPLPPVPVGQLIGS